MTDFKGNELNVGDKILYTLKSYGTLKEGLIFKMNKSQITVKYAEPIQHVSGTYKWTQKFEDRIVSPSLQCLKVG